MSTNVAVSTSERMLAATEDSDACASFTPSYLPQDTSPLSDLSQTTASGAIINAELYSYIQTIVNLWTVLVLSVVGAVTNTLFLMVIVKQGFKEGVNISLAAITIWDLVKCLGSVIHRLYGPVLLVHPAMGTSWRNMTFPVMTYLPLFSGYVASALATYVAVERCLSVAMPLKVKSLFTPKFTLIVVIIISLSVFGAFSIMFFIYDVIYVKSIVYNTTIAVYIYNNFYFANETAIMIYYKYIGLLLPTTSFIILCVTSAITIKQLKRHGSSLYRIRDTNFNLKGSNRQLISRRETRVIRTLLVVVVTYMINTFPRIPVYIATLIEPEFYILKHYNNLFMTILYLIYILDFSNASSSFFIFLKMSTKFRRTFFAIFSLSKQQT